MILHSLELQAFGDFRDQVITFAPGMNLISGANETGKTTVARSVAAVLFGLDDATRFLPWEDPRVCRAALVLEEGDRRIRIERDFVSGCVKWFEAVGEDEFACLFSGYHRVGETTVDGQAYLARLQELLGVGRLASFEALSYIDPSESVPGFSPERLGACFSAGDTQALQAVLQDLQHDCLALSADNPWGLQAQGEGRLEQIAGRLAALEQEWFALQEAIRSGAPEESSGDAEDAKTDSADQAGAPVEAAPAAVADEPSEVAAPCAPEAAAVPVDAAARRRQIEAELEKTGLPRQVPAALPDLLNEAAEVRQIMAEQKRALEARKEEQRRCRAPGLKKPLLALVGVWALLGAWTAAKGTLLPVWAGLCATALAGAWYAWCFWQARAAGLGFNDQLVALEAGIEELRVQLAELTDRFEALGISPSPVEMVRMQKNLPRHRRLLDELRQLENAAGGDGGEGAQPVAEPPEQPPENVLDESLRSVQDETPTPQPEAAVEVRPTSGERGALRESCIRIECEGETLRARESRLKGRLRTLRTACELLTDTLGEAAGADLETFAPCFEQVLAELTAGAVERVRITPDYALQLPGPDGAWLPVERFGSATRTLVQVALCLAFATVHDEGARLPLLFDDPLQPLDRKRRGQLLKVLEQYVPMRQVILFSHDESLRRRATREGWHLVSLRSQGAPVAATSEEKNKDDGQLSFL